MEDTEEEARVAEKEIAESDLLENVGTNATESQSSRGGRNSAEVRTMVNRISTGVRLETQGTEPVLPEVEEQEDFGTQETLGVETREPYSEQVVDNREACVENEMHVDLWDPLFWVCVIVVSVGIVMISFGIPTQQDISGRVENDARNDASMRQGNSYDILEQRPLYQFEYKGGLIESEDQQPPQGAVLHSELHNTRTQEQVQEESNPEVQNPPTRERLVQAQEETHPQAAGHLTRQQFIQDQQPHVSIQVEEEVRTPPPQERTVQAQEETHPQAAGHLTRQQFIQDQQPRVSIQVEEEVRTPPPQERTVQAQEKTHPQAAGHLTRQQFIQDQQPHVSIQVEEEVRTPPPQEGILQAQEETHPQAAGHLTRQQFIQDQQPHVSIQIEEEVRTPPPQERTVKAQEKTHPQAAGHLTRQQFIQDQQPHVSIQIEEEVRTPPPQERTVQAQEKTHPQAAGHLTRQQFIQDQQPHVSIQVEEEVRTPPPQEGILQAQEETHPQAAGHLTRQQFIQDQQPHVSIQIEEEVQNPPIRKRFVPAEQETRQEAVDQQTPQKDGRVRRVLAGRNLELNWNGVNLFDVRVPPAGGYQHPFCLIRTCSVDSFVAIAYVHLLLSRTLFNRLCDLLQPDFVSHISMPPNVYMRYKEIRYLYWYCSERQFAEAKFLVYQVTKKFRTDQDCGRNCHNGSLDMYNSHTSAVMPFLEPIFWHNVRCTKSRCNCHRQSNGTEEIVIRPQEPYINQRHGLIQSAVNHYLECRDSQETTCRRRHFLVPPMFVPINFCEANVTAQQEAGGLINLERLIDFDGERYQLAAIVYWQNHPVTGGHFTSRIRLPMELNDRREEAWVLYLGNNENRLVPDEVDPNAYIEYVYYVHIPRNN